MKTERELFEEAFKKLIVAFHFVKYMEYLMKIMIGHFNSFMGLVYVASIRKPRGISLYLLRLQIHNGSRNRRIYSSNAWSGIFYLHQLFLISTKP